MAGGRGSRAFPEGLDGAWRLTSGCPSHVFLCVSFIHKRISGFLGQVQGNPRVDFTVVCRKLVVCLLLFK